MKAVYNEYYLDDAMHCLGEAFDYAVNACKLDSEIFLELFISTGLAEQFQSGSPKILSGLSGMELVLETLLRAGLSTDNCPTGQTDFGYSDEYRCGSVLAYYQYCTGRTFDNIREIFSIDDMYGLYSVLQKYGEKGFVEAVERVVRSKRTTSRLQAMRKRRGLSQSKLATLASVNLRTLQQYEAGSKDINKASASSVYALSVVLGCTVEEILEH